MSNDSTARLSADIATVVRGLLAERRIDGLEFSQRIGLPNSTVHRWLKGGKFDTDALEAIAGGLGMDPAELVSRAMQKRAERELRGISPEERADLDQAVRRRRSEPIQDLGESRGHAERRVNGR